MADLSAIETGGYTPQSKPKSTIFNIISRKVLIIGSISIIGMMTVIAYINTGEEEATATRPITDKVNPNARKGAELEVNAPDSSPVKKQKVETEKKENLEAKEVTNSHVKDAILLDSTPKQQINKESASNVPVVVTPEPTPPVVSKPDPQPPAPERQPTANKQGNDKQMTRQERIQIGIEKLSRFESPYLVADNDVGNKALKKFNDYFNKGVSESNVYNGGSEQTYKTEFGKQLIAKKKKTDAERSKKETKSDKGLKSQKANNIMPEDYLMQFGDTVHATVTQAFSTDFDLPVMAEIWQPPLQDVRVKGGYEWDEYENGIVLRFTQLYPTNLPPVRIDAFGVDVDGENTPLFDQDIDRHYWLRFWSRASAAFIAPWLDFATTTSQIISGGEIIEIINPVTSTTDKVIGSVGNVAKEFLPELQRNSDRAPTANLPLGYPVKIVFLQPLISLEPQDDDGQLSNITDKVETFQPSNNIPATPVRSVSSMDAVKQNVIDNLLKK
ncbi:hypothetical protein [Photobacterium leiognathi]|uniref:hypothetical protein n=1 Tax=Photobacterium leiognathi TaxID=553611 RepID=UPI002980B3D7|nr:hypothetical protein [Photobacterium leiognathi]